MEKTSNTITVTFTNLPDGLIELIKEAAGKYDKEVDGIKIITPPETNTFSIDTRFMENKAEVLARIFTEYARASFGEKFIKKLS